MRKITLFCLLFALIAGSAFAQRMREPVPIHPTDLERIRWVANDFQFTLYLNGNFRWVDNMDLGFRRQWGNSVFGTYVIEGNEIIFTFDNGRTEIMTWRFISRLEGNAMFITRRGQTREIRMMMESRGRAG